MNSPYSFAIKSWQIKAYIKLNGCFVIIRRNYSYKSLAHKYITTNDKNRLLFVLTILNPGRTNGPFILYHWRRETMEEHQKSCAVKSPLWRDFWTTLFPVISNSKFPTDTEHILRFYDKVLFLSSTKSKKV